MLVDIKSYNEPYISKGELQVFVEEAKDIGFIERKYNQIGYLYNLLGKLDNLVFVGEELYFKEDAKQIFGEDLVNKTKKRDSYLHRLYKKTNCKKNVRKFMVTQCVYWKNFHILY